MVCDILIWAESKEELEERIRKVMEKCRERQITISALKLTVWGQKKALQSRVTRLPTSRVSRTFLPGRVISMHNLINVFLANRSMHC